MTVPLRIDSLSLHTTEGQTSYSFSADLTVLTGPTGVGKTTLLELIKFGFAAGEARLAAVATDSVNDVVLEVTIGEDRLRIARSLDTIKRKKVRITDLRTGERLPDHSVGEGEPNLNSLLLGKLGLPADIRAAAQKSKSSKAGSRVTFGDVFKYVYVPQYAINRDIADSRDGYYDPKRKAVFELLFGLTDPDILSLQSEVNVLNGSIDSAAKQHKTVLDFLRDTNTSSRDEVEEQLRDTLAEQESARAQLQSLREELDPVIDRQTQALRDLLTDAERSLAEARATAQSLARQRDEIKDERRRVQADLARLERMRDAGVRLANIEFSVCPRCMQSLKRRSVDAALCRVCLQPDPIEPEMAAGSYEIQQLKQQLDEMEDQHEATAELLQEAERAVTDRVALVRNLTATLDSRTAQRVTPRLQAFSDASDQFATARTQHEQLEMLLRQWDRVADIEREVQELRTRQDHIKGDIASRKSALAARRNEVLSAIEEEFKMVVAGLNIAAVESAGFDKENYLPIINGKTFTKTLMSGGGSMTATQIAYWTSLISVAQRFDARYPSLLIIDGPRLALNTAAETCGAIYKRLVRLANEEPGEVQLLVSDNELPTEYQNGFEEMTFDYLRPTVYTIRHPGEGRVDLISSVDE
ncbi:hypothetical protein DMH02_003190 [Streptomyces sp. WAC 00631]|uniref:hypothetical protein n=1 Tax=Streptomyces sp. WAC 00631 TaxID=2203201 RepID=UPI000F7A025A|nr:hypothetical protein [Streptomyces sp. WAC 00631]MCC5032284.1 hypothetical protein [Streptomyces sp. WAC 00631]